MTRKRLPSWLRRELPRAGRKDEVEHIVTTSSLSTVCEEAKCPNRAECFSGGTATFLIMNDICTRHCRFCSVKKGQPKPLDSTEPKRVLKAVEKMNLAYIVLTSVNRDDLHDGGAAHFAQCVKELKKWNRNLLVETLVPDFGGNEESIKTILLSGIDLFNHNIEMPQRLYPHFRFEAEYQQSLRVLEFAKKEGSVPVKSGCMVGLGEQEEEIYALLDDLRSVKVDIVTIGQYLQPSSRQIAVDRFVTPEEFQRYKEYGEQIGIPHVEAGPFVRSSYNAAKIIERIDGVLA